MKFIKNLKKKYFPVRYWQEEFSAFEKNFESRSPQETWQEYQNRRAYHDSEAWEFIELIRSHEDPKLVRKAEKRGIYLEDIPLPPVENPHDQGYYVYGSCGERMLHSDVRKQLEKLIRSRESDYKRERREFWQFWLTNVLALIGALTGLGAVWNE